MTFTITHAFRMFRRGYLAYIKNCYTVSRLRHTNLFERQVCDYNHQNPPIKIKFSNNLLSSLNCNVNVTICSHAPIPTRPQRHHAPSKFTVKWIKSKYNVGSVSLFVRSKYVCNDSPVGNNTNFIIVAIL